MNKINFTSDQTNHIVDLYINKKISCKEIGKIIGCSKQVINALLRFNKIELRDLSHCQQKYYIDENSFCKIDTREKAYWLGMIAGDGWAYDNHFGISLKESDKDHIYKFRSFLKSNHPITILNNGIMKNGKQSLSHSIRIWNKNIINDLNNLGIDEHKTKNLKFPVIDERFYSSFILGMIDADGWMKVDTKRNMLTIGLGSTLDFTTKCQDILIKTCELNKTKLYQSSQTDFLYSMYYGGNKQALRIVKYLYTDCPIWLPRKKNKAIQHLIKCYPNDIWLKQQLKDLLTSKMP